MAAVQKRIVHKQFNSPIAIYSNNNIQQVLDRELKELSNGTVGIDFKNDPTTVVPPSLAKSAVLKALEDEEREKRGLKRVAWPPPPQNDDYKVVRQPQFPPKPTFQHQVGANTESTSPAEYPVVAAANDIAPIDIPAAAPPTLPSVAQPSSTVAFSGGVAVRPVVRPVVAPLAPFAPANLGSGSFLPSPSTATPSSLSPVSLKGWKPVRPPVNTAPTFAAPTFESTPAPFIPPPTEPQQDYSSFFAQNALNSTYPGYRAPPGTQHIGDSTPI